MNCPADGLEIESRTGLEPPAGAKTGEDICEITQKEHVM